MTRLEIETKFREENSEITANVVSAATLHSWCLVGDKEICAKARLIVTNGTIDAVSGTASYDLTTLTKFYDIDSIPGGGVSRVDTSGNEKRLDMYSKSQLDQESPSWRTASSGTPKKYFRRGKYISFYPKPDSTINYFNVDYVAISDDFNNDNIIPFNQLTYLEPFHPALVFYLTWRAKAKVGKPEEAASAKLSYDMYVAWMRKEIGGGKSGPIQFVPSGLPSMGQYR